MPWGKLAIQACFLEYPVIKDDHLDLGSFYDPSMYYRMAMGNDSHWNTKGGGVPEVSDRA